MAEAKQEDIDKAMATADRILEAVKKKIPKYEGFTRRYDSGGTGFIELALRPEGTGSRSNEISTAYSDEFFLSANADNIKDKAKRILHDFRVVIGVRE